jgi:beta-glucanase (GH16 family)
MKTLLIIALLSFPVSVCAETRLSDDWVAFNRAGAPNSNSQCFTPNNVSVSDGNLVIITRPETSTCSSFDLPSATYNYTSGYVSMRRFNFLYGTVEIRAKFGGGVGTGSWPCVWLEDASCQASDPTGTDDNCNGQEIDIAEILNSKFDQVNQQIHVDGYTHSDGCTAYTSDTSQNFHIYQLVWSLGSLVFKIDGAKTCTITKSYVPNAPMYLKVDAYVESDGGPVKRESLPWTTLVDYVKVTQEPNVVFFDDFDGKPTLQFRPAVSLSSFPLRRTHAPSSADSILRWPSWTLVIGLVVLLAIAAAKVRNRRQSRGE